MIRMKKGGTPLYEQQEVRPGMRGLDPRWFTVAMVMRDATRKLEFPAVFVSLYMWLWRILWRFWKGRTEIHLSRLGRPIGTSLTLDKWLALRNPGTRVHLIKDALPLQIYIGFSNPNTRRPLVNIFGYLLCDKIKQYGDRYMWETNHYLLGNHWILHRVSLALLHIR